MITNIQKKLHKYEQISKVNKNVLLKIYDKNYPKYPSKKTLSLFSLTRKRNIVWDQKVMGYRLG